MTDRAHTAFLIRLTMAHVLVWAVTTARAQEAEPLKDRDVTTDRSSISAPGKKIQSVQRTENVKPARSEASRWERFRDSVGRFRSRRDPESSSGQDKRRSLLGEKVKYAPGEGAEFPEFSPMKADTSVSPTKREIPQEVAPPPFVPSNGAGTQRLPVHAGSGDDPASAVPPLDPLPTPTPEQPGSFGVGETEAEAALADTSAPQSEQEPYGLGKRFLRGYPTLVLWFPTLLGPPRESDSTAREDEFRAGERSGGGGYESPGAPRRAPPSPWDSPPFPTSEYQGYPLIGVPPSANEDPMQKALLLGPFGDQIRDSRIEFHGWVTMSGNWSNARNSNLPTAYWIVPNTVQVDQAIVRFEREADTVQTDHMDWGFRAVGLYGIDYRYTTAGGVFSQQLLYHNNLYGFDPVEFFAELYIPNIFEGMSIRLGRWIACPDIEAQYAPDNYLASHSLLFTYDTYTQTGAMFSFQINQRNMIQGAIQSGTDMAPWYVGAVPTGFFGWRWISQSNNDAFYTCLNNVNNAKFRYFMADGRKAGHDNFNYIVSTWEHRFSQKIHTKTEAYYMWQFDAVVGGTPSLGPPMSFGGGGGLGKFLPGNSPAYGVLNYTMFQLSKRDYFTLRNEWWRDQRGERSGFATNYSSHTIGISHQFNDRVMIRPEIGYYHSYDVPAFDLGKSKDLLMGGFDLTIRF
jgi:hypothetical protein